VADSGELARKEGLTIRCTGDVRTGCALSSNGDFNGSPNASSLSLRAQMLSAVFLPECKYPEASGSSVDATTNKAFENAEVVFVESADHKQYTDETGLFIIDGYCRNTWMPATVRPLQPSGYADC